MYHIPKDKRAEKSVEKICNGFLQMLESKSFLDISISDIQKATKIGRSTFYRLFDNTSDVLSYLCDKIFMETDIAIEKNNKANAQKTTLCFIEKFMQNKTLLSAIVDSNRIDFLQNAHTKFLTSKSANFFLKPTSSELTYTTSAITACTCAFIVTWFKNGAKENPQELQMELKKCFNHLGKIFG